MPEADERALSSREREVLETVVEQYIQTGVPIGSRALAKTNSEGLSPATIRSIMADLEESGYLTHPHTSAGRIPTDRGYRYFVDATERKPRLSGNERRTIAENLYAAGGLDSLLARCTRLLAATSNQVSIATAVDHDETRYRHVEFVKLTPDRLLVLFVASSGQVHQSVIEARVDVDQEELERQARFLNAQLEGRTLSEVRDRLARLMKEERAAYDELARRALTLGAQYFAESPSGAGEIVIDGTERFFEKPDLTDFDRMKALVAALEDKARLLRILSDCLDRGGERVMTAIGSENLEPDFSSCSVVAAGYGPDDRPAGALAIIGPTRMDYDRAMALVGYVADLLGSAYADRRR